MIVRVAQIQTDRGKIHTLNTLSKGFSEKVICYHHPYNRKITYVKSTILDYYRTF